LHKTSEDIERIISRILRVNHSGEHGAMAIYTAQYFKLVINIQNCFHGLRKPSAMKFGIADYFMRLCPSATPNHVVPCIYGTLVVSF